MVDLDRVALYSALYGRYEHPKPVPADLGCRAIMYVDTNEVADEARAAGWEPRVVPAPVSVETLQHAQRVDPAATTPMLYHKWWKTHPRQAVPEAEVTFWVDASLLITVDRYAQRCLDALGDDDWCAVRHPYRDCVYTEAEFSALLPRYDADSLRRQVAAYQAYGHPEHWGLIATGANVRRHNTAAQEVSAWWWQECVTRSHQDQVSLPVLFRLASWGPLEGPLDVPFRWNANLPWATWWGVYEHGRAKEGV